MYSKKIKMYIIYSNFNLVVTFNIGKEEIVKEFFSSISYHLENQKWGSIYPTIMNKLYKGKIEPQDVNEAIKEIKDIKNKLKQRKVNEMIETSGEISKLALHELYSKENIDEVFVNDKGEKITDVILSALKTIRNKKVPLYIGDYHLKELDKNNLDKIINESKKVQTKNELIKYIIYALILVLVKLITTTKTFNNFFKIFIFCIIFSIISDTVAKSKAKSYFKTLEEKNNSNNNLPSMRIEKITLQKDIFSSTFDSILDEINCKKTFEGINKKLELTKIKNWQSDLKEISSELNYDEKYSKRMIEKLKLSYKKIETYELKSDVKILSNENRGDIYTTNNIYRIIKADNDIYLIMFLKEK